MSQLPHPDVLEPVDDTSWIELSDALVPLLHATQRQLTGRDRRLFMARVVQRLGPGGQRKAEKRLEWNRKTIRKAIRELESGFVCVDAFSLRGKKSVLERWPNLADDIEQIAAPHCQTDATFRTSTLYVRLTARTVRQLLITEKGYDPHQMPARRTVSRLLNRLGYHLRKVKKNQPLKKIPETNAIFATIHEINRAADEQPDVLRISMDAKAAVKIGAFSRGGESRVEVNARDHDFQPDAILTPFSLLLPQHDELLIFLAESKVTSDFIWDRLEDLWPQLKAKYDPSTLVLNQDNGPESHSRRTQFIKRAVEFAQRHGITIRLAYYPPYHSKYNPVERTHGILEQHWNGILLLDIDTALKAAADMTWKGKHPTVQLVSKTYEKGVKLTKAVMAQYERCLKRLAGLGRWFVDIEPCPDALG